MKEEIICAGFGGQGIMLLGKLITFGGMNSSLHVTWMPSYGAEVRGGTAYCMVVLSDDEIASPLVSLCDTVIAMNKPSFDKFISNLRPEGLIIANSSLVTTDSPRKDIKTIKVPMTDIAYKFGNVRLANMVALGVYIKNKKLFTKESIIEGISIAFGEDKELQNLNIKALEKGMGIK
jgi:2-oxoglutarate ferredoxin oxidoreductase subunit gamma